MEREKVDKQKWYKPIFQNLLEYITIVVAIVVCILAAIGSLKDNTVLSATCAILSILCGFIIHEKTKRIDLQKNINTLNNEIIKVKDIINQLETGITIIKKEIPNIKELITLSNQSASVDSVFRELDEKRLLHKAQKEIFLIQESGDKIFQLHRDYLTEFLHKGNKIKWVVVTCDNTEITKLMAFRNHDLVDFKNMQKRLEQSIHNFSDIKRALGKDRDNLEIRFFSYPIDITGVFIDRVIANGYREALIRLQGFKTKYSQKPCIELYESHSPKIYNFYDEQIEKIWKHSSKCILLTGDPRVGKSTLLAKIVKKLEDDNKNENCINKIKLNGFITNDIWDNKNNNRIGFKTHSITNKTSMILAKKNLNNDYILNEKIIDDLIIPSIQVVLNKFSHSKELKSAVGFKDIIVENEDIQVNLVSHLLIIDEIGPIQLQSKKFEEIINKAFNINSIPILGIIANSTESNSFIDKIKTHYRTKVIEVNTENRDILVEELYNELKLN